MLLATQPDSPAALLIWGMFGVVFSQPVVIARISCLNHMAMHQRIAFLVGSNVLGLSSLAFGTLAALSPANLSADLHYISFWGVLALWQWMLALCWAATRLFSLFVPPIRPTAAANSSQRLESHISPNEAEQAPHSQERRFEYFTTLDLFVLISLLSIAFALTRNALAPDWEFEDVPVNCFAVLMAIPIVAIISHLSLNSLLAASNLRQSLIRTGGWFVLAIVVTNGMIAAGKIMIVLAGIGQLPSIGEFGDQQIARIVRAFVAPDHLNATVLLSSFAAFTITVSTAIHREPFSARAERQQVEN